MQYSHWILSLCSHKSMQYYQGLNIMLQDFAACHMFMKNTRKLHHEKDHFANSEMSQRYSHGRIKPLGGIPIVNNLLGIDGFSMFTMCITTCEVCVCVTMFLLKYECVCNTVSVDGFSVFITTCPIYRFIMPHYILEMCDHSSMLRF